MNTQQRKAWFDLGVFAAALAAYLVLLPLVGALPALGSLGLLGLWGLGGQIFYHRRGRWIVFDEREEEILRRSTAIAYNVFWIAFVAGCMIPWSVLFRRGQETISVQVLPHLVFGGLIVVMVTRAVATLLLHRGGPGSGDG